MDVKKVKEDFRIKASKDPDKYYATSVLKEEGFARRLCRSCKRYFWNTTDSNICGDPACSGGFRFIDQTPAKEKLDYIQVWKRFASQFKKLGYEPIKRYPTAARWRDDTDFVQASIYDFQPYVVSGEVDPPANPLVVPQMCLRFNDIDNVGITGAHYTSFVMIGQHAFVPKKKWDQPQYFRDIHAWLAKGLGLPNDEITYHEDAWAGGGNYGPCMEFFSRGLELGNQVYMLYEIDSDGNHKELPLKVLDMGMGQERNAWFTGTAPTSYETTFPTVVKNLQQATGIKVDKQILQKFLPYSSYLNIDEVDNIDKTWEIVSKKVGVSSDELKKQILPLSALYSVAEHSRSLLVALSDGILPSNVGGGYNLRVILRRALGFIDSYGWKVDLAKMCELHAAYLKPQFPELSENLKEVAEVLEVERRKHNESKGRARQVVSRLLQKGQISEEKLIELYDSQGINPSQIAEEASHRGKKIVVPENFYALVAEKHEAKVQQAASKREQKFDLEGVQATEALYYHDYKKIKFKAKVVQILDKNVILDKTYFFPTSGGQINDTGKLDEQDVVDVFRQGKHILHVLKDKPDFHEGFIVEGKIDFDRRKQLSQHHTVTHVFNQLLRKHLGKHAWQAGTAKLLDKARLDMTHYDNLSSKQLSLIEAEANKIIKKGLEVKSSFVPRTEAEQKYGFGIYQGPVVPGKELRIVEIKGFDVEACGGTHVHTTSEIKAVKIIKSSKVQDGVVRIEYAAGKAFDRIEKGSDKIMKELARLLKCKPEQIPGRAEELFDKWKKKIKKGKDVDVKLSATKSYEGDVIKRTAEIFRTQPEHLVKTAKRFLEELNK